MAKILIRLGDHPRATSDRWVWQEGDVIAVHPDRWTPRPGAVAAIRAGRFALIELPGVDPSRVDYLTDPEMGVEANGEPGQVGRLAKQLDITQFSAEDIAQMRAGDTVTSNEATIVSREVTRDVRGGGR